MTHTVNAHTVALAGRHLGRFYITRAARAAGPSRGCPDERPAPPFGSPGEKTQAAGRPLTSTADKAP